MKRSARAHLLTAATPQGTCVAGGPFSTSMMRVTLSSLVPPPAPIGPVRLALWNDLRDKAGSAPRRQQGKSLNQVILPWISSAQPLATAEQSTRGNCR